jgi:hypothetical protein
MRLPGNYTGSSEWLVYGYVEKSAIVASYNISDLLNSSICTREFISVLKLDAIQRASSMSVLNQNWEQLASPMTYETGQEVGKREFSADALPFFANLPKFYDSLEFLTTTRSWWLQSFRMRGSYAASERRSQTQPTKRS